MRTYSKYRAIAFSLLAGLVALGAFYARAGGEGGAPGLAPRPEAAAPQPVAPEARPDVVRALPGERREASLSKLEAEARDGVLAAQVRLARIYSLGRGAAKDDAKAFNYYRQIIDEHADVDYYDPGAKYVTEAFRALAGYYRTGVPALGLAANPVEAGKLLWRAASDFQDPMAQYTLGKMFLAGEGVGQNSRMAMSLLFYASRKRYAPAQAVLGDLLWRGRNVKRLPAEGLALLALARDNAIPEDKLWIGKLYEEARLGASDNDLQAAEKVLPKLNGFRVNQGGALQIVRPGQIKLEIIPIGRDDPLADQSREAGERASVLLGQAGGEDELTPPARPVDAGMVPFGAAFDWPREGALAPASQQQPVSDASNSGER